MCFYYSITKKSINKLVKGKIIKESQLSLFDEKYIVNGFDHPLMPIITDDLPEDIQHVQWGFLPAKVDSLDNASEFLNKYNTLNAKIEDIEDSRLYADSYYNKRCLILCSGFFEWQKVKKEKVPYYITLKEDEIFVFAGIWNETIDSKGKSIKSYAILTIEANEFMASIHNIKKRMPLILSPENAKQWINPDLSPNELKSIIHPLTSEQFKAHTIKRFLPGNAKNLNTSDIVAYYNYPQIGDILNSNNTLF